MTRGTGLLAGESLCHLQTAYVALLRLPHGSPRIRLQSTLAALRDEIALRTGEDAEDVQNKYEAAVANHLSAVRPTSPASADVAGPQATVDEIVTCMGYEGYSVEMTHKSGFRKDRIPTDWIAGWEHNFNENLARCLVEGYESKGAFVALIEILLTRATLTRVVPPATLPADVADIRARCEADAVITAWRVWTVENYAPEPFDAFDAGYKAALQSALAEVGRLKDMAAMHKNNAIDWQLAGKEDSEKIATLTSECERLKADIAIRNPHITTWQGTCGHQWRKDQSDECPMCQLATLTAECEQAKARNGELAIEKIEMRERAETAEAECERLHVALSDCADDLEAYVEDHYKHTKDHPAMKWRYERDMAPVKAARALQPAAATEETNETAV